MSPGGHLVTAVLAAGGAAALTGSLPLAAGVGVGGFLIDVDHFVDYVVVERQRDLRPGAFLRYYIEGRVRRMVLVLHSYELLALLGAIAWWQQSPALGGWLLGALMHLALDIVFNGRLTPRSIWGFYSFGYRLAHHFDAQALFGAEPLQATRGFWVGFFGGARPSRPGQRALARG